MESIKQKNLHKIIFSNSWKLLHPFWKINIIYFVNCFHLQKNWADGTEIRYNSFIHFFLLLVYCISVVHLFKFINEYYRLLLTKIHNLYYGFLFVFYNFVDFYMPILCIFVGTVYYDIAKIPSASLVTPSSLIASGRFSLIVSVVSPFSVYHKLEIYSM